MFTLRTALSNRGATLAAAISLIPLAGAQDIITEE